MRRRRQDRGMTAEVIYGIDFRAKDRTREQRLEAMAIEIMNSFWEPPRYVQYYHDDTAPSEMNPKEPA